MKYTIALCLAVAAVSFPAATAVAQEAAASVPFALNAPPMTVANIDEPYGDGVFWVRGETYKARVDRTGVGYYPLFGGAKTHTPIAFRCVGPACTKVERDAQALVLRRGPVLTERWETRVAGMEQSFVVAVPPASGDLVLRVGVETGLEYRGRDQGLVFAAPGLGSVRYGDGVVFDQKGRRAAVIPEFDGEAIALRVPAAFLAAADCPITIDPLVNSFTVSQAGSNDFHPDVVREPGSGDFMVVFEEVLTSTDHDVVGHLYRDDGTFVRRVFFDSTADLCIDPKICATLGATGVLAVWDNDGNGDGIQSREYRFTANSFQATQQVTSDGLGVDTFSPDVGGGTTLGFNNVGQMCVYARVSAAVNFSLRGTALQSNGVPQGNEFVIDGAPGCDPRPEISQSGGVPLHWAVAWQAKTAVCNGGDIWFAMLNLGGVQRAAAALEAGPADELLPKVVTHDKDSLFLWQETTATFAQDVAAVLIRRSNTAATWSQVGVKIALSAGEPGVTRGNVQSQGVPAFDGCRHSYVYMEGQRPKAACMFAPEYLFSEGHVALSTTTNNCGAPAIAHVPTAGSAVRYATVWQEDVGTRFEVRGAFYEGRQAGASVSTVLTGCGIHGGVTTIGIDRVPAVGHDFTVALAGVSGVPLLIAGPPAISPVTLCGGINPCEQGIVTILASLFAPSMRIDVPCVSNLVGDSIAFQGADLGAANGCGPALFGLPFRTTDTIVVTFR